MKEKIITRESMEQFKHFLEEDEKSPATIHKYGHDLQCFAEYIQGRQVRKADVLSYKTWLGENYAVASANSMLSAMNKYLCYMGWNDCCVKQFKMQKSAYCSEQAQLTKDEYMRLLETAKAEDNNRVFLLMQTICCTGIRVSEVEYITVEALQRGEAQVNCKGKIRRIFIINQLCLALLKYAEEKGIFSGPVFRSRNNTPLNRCCIWKSMKKLCRKAGIPEGKVYPHNLRHLFARTFYEKEKDIAKLADVLGHSNINTTRIYTITTGEEHKKKMEQMELVYTTA